MAIRYGVVSAIVTSSLLFATAPSSCNSTSGSGGGLNIGPSGAEVAGAIVGVSAVIVGAVVLVEVHHSHHTLKGCVASTSDGLQMISASGGETYALSGTTTDLKVGDTVRVHGAKHKQKGSAERTFVVEKLNKDYGPCKASPAKAGTAQGSTE